ncbi:MAG: hypothetical protein DDT36_01746 [Firmicutes bacterium]|nr:hypothetical protein [Bacillota bacterium]
MGKTTTTANIGVALAELGHRVALSVLGHEQGAGQAPSQASPCV